MKEEVRILLEKTQTISAELAQDQMKIASKISKDSCEEHIERLYDILQILTPLEINIRKLDFQLKHLKILLCCSSEYMSEYKTIKAREEQAFQDTFEIRENILSLKLERNKLRDLVEYLRYSIECWLVDPKC